MAEEVGNVFAAEPSAAGAAFVAPLGTTLPTSVDGALDAAFVGLGYVGEDGITETSERSTDEKKDMGGRIVKVLQTEYNHSFKFVLLESLNADVLKSIYGASNVTVTPADGTHGTQVKVRKTSKKLPHQTWVFDTIDSELSAKYRNCVADGQVISVGDVTLASKDTIEYEVELKVFESSTGEYVTTYTDDGRIAGS
ncbi:phage tail tube protein [Mycobacteroides abscessus]|uniref:phage tail tube protein n=1 Tax=Mycobacteroides abscessus TaxID=36809 RepID=UPI0009A6997E|nr:hypothetical protein [Mycobacteroides abscessus]RIU09665.1 hypothetical protein D2E94_11210 [Mycobacteroides abscessus]SLF58241.1 Phage associated (putative structural protein) [Mycobacteroides abscessus subsp. abscessus]